PPRRRRSAGRCPPQEEAHRSRARPPRQRSPRPLRVTPPDNDAHHPEMVIVVAHRCAASMTILRTTPQSAEDDHPRPATPSRRSDGHPRPHTPCANPMPINQPVYEPISQPARAHLVLVANVLRLETPERAASLVARLARAVAPGGGLLVVDALAGGTPERERARALYAVNLALRSHAGRVHDAGEIAAWLRAAGLGAPVTIDLGGSSAPPGAVGALLARK